MKTWMRVEKKKKVMVIENQFKQFDEIAKFLDFNDYDTYPQREPLEYKYFLDLVRIYLNPRYPGKRRSIALDKILEAVDSYRPDLIILDHVLVGSHQAKDGLDLAIELRTKGLNVPIIFFSRTEINHVQVCEKLPLVVGETHWVFKGFSGADILEDGFLQQILAPKLKAVFVLTKHQELRSMLQIRRPKASSSESKLSRAINDATNKLILQLDANLLDISEEMSSLMRTADEATYLQLLESISK